MTSFYSRSGDYIESTPNRKSDYLSYRLVSVITPVMIITLSWNGLPDRVTNSTYLILSFIALSLFVKFGQVFQLANVSPLIFAILISTLTAILLGTQRLPDLNNLQNQIFSTSQLIGEQSVVYSPLTDVIPAVKWVLALISLPYIVQILKMQYPQILRNCIYAWIAGVVLNSTTQILQSIGFARISTATFHPETFSGSRFPGLASHPNALAITVCLTLPLVYFPVLKFSKIVRILLTLFFSASILITGSRAGIIVFAAGLILVMSKNRMTGKFRLSIILILIFASLLIILSGFSEMLISNTRLNSQDLSARASNSARLSLLKFGWTAFFDYPLTGAGAALIKVSHNIYLQILSSIGLIGFFAFINFIVKTMSNSFKASYLEKIPLIVFLMFGLLNNSLSDFYLYFPLAFAYAIKSKLKKNEDNIN